MIKVSILPRYSKNAESQRQWNFEMSKVTHNIQKPSAINDWLFNKAIEFRGQCKGRAMDLKHWSTKNLINSKIVFQKLKPTRFQFQPWLRSPQSHSYKKKFWTNWESIFFLNPSEKGEHRPNWQWNSEIVNHKILQIKLKRSRSC